MCMVECLKGNWRLWKVKALQLNTFKCCVHKLQNWCDVLLALQQVIVGRTRE